MRKTLLIGVVFQILAPDLRERDRVEPCHRDVQVQREGDVARVPVTEVVSGVATPVTNLIFYLKHWCKAKQKSYSTACLMSGGWQGS